MSQENTCPGVNIVTFKCFHKKTSTETNAKFHQNGSYGSQNI